MKKIKISLFLCACVLFLSAGTFMATAKTPSYVPYGSYEYTHYGSIAAPTGYIPSQEITGATIGLTVPLNSPTDLYYDNKDTIYILDSGNSRIIAVDKNFKLKKTYDKFYDQSNSPISFTGAQGFTVGPDGTFYIADTTNERILIIGQDGIVKRIITKPNNAQMNTGIPFDVIKVLLDNKGQIYALAKSVTIGAFVFSPDGQFQEYRCSNPIVPTLQSVLNYISKPFLTKAQRAAMVQATPANFANFDIDKNGFIYTVTVGTSSTAQAGVVRELNYKSDDILGNGKPILFGDTDSDRMQITGYAEDYTNAKATKNSFTDIDIDSQGYLNILDSGRGKVFQYSSDGDLIAVFGAYGDRMGCFSDPVAIESVDDQIYVLDMNKNCIYDFTPTDYVKDLRDAFQKLSTNDLNGSMIAWNKVLKENTNSLYPYKGLGLAYDTKGDYQTAMQYFKLADEHSLYSDSFLEFRKIFVRENILPIFLLILFGFALIYFLIKFLKKLFIVKDGDVYSKIESKYTFPIYLLAHPVDGFDQFKSRKIQSYRVSFIIVILWTVLKSFQFFCMGYSFNMNRAIDYSFTNIFVQTIGVFFLFAIANWAVCTLFDGKGSLKEIMAVVSYSLVPLLLSILINVLLSNMLTADESAYLSIITAVGILWTVFLLLSGLYSIHQYSFSKTIVSVLFTIIGMAVIIFIVIMFYTLLQQCFDFIVSVYSEASLR